MKKKQLKLPIIKVSEQQMSGTAPIKPPRGYRFVKRGVVHKKDYTFYYMHPTYGNAWVEADGPETLGVAVDIGVDVEDFYAVARKIK